MTEPLLKQPCPHCGAHHNRGTQRPFTCWNPGDAQRAVYLCAPSRKAAAERFAALVDREGASAGGVLVVAVSAGGRAPKQFHVSCFVSTHYAVLTT